MPNLPRIGIPPLVWAGLPLPSTVRGRIIAGFGLPIIILAAVVLGSAWLAREHRSDLADLEQRAATASFLEETRFQFMLENLFLGRYVITGDERLIPMVRSSVAIGTASMAEASANIEAQGREAEVAGLDELIGEAAFLSDTSEQVIALRRSGDMQQARAALEPRLPLLRVRPRAHTSEHTRLAPRPTRHDRDHTGVP